MFLLDVNLLIALLDPLHASHSSAHVWFELEGHKGFVTCPITENGFLRIVSHPKYSNPQASPAVAAGALRSLRAHPAHQFWPDSLSLLDAPVHADRLLSHEQITDIYLLALAVSQGGRLATFNGRINSAAVSGGREALLVLARRA